MMPLTKLAARVQARLDEANLEENPVAQAVKENRRRKGSKKPSAAQLRAREKFARMARSGKFKRKRRKKELAQNRKMSKRRSRRMEDNRRNRTYQANRGRKYESNQSAPAKSQQENASMAAELEENARKGKKRGKKRRKGRRKGRKTKRRAKARSRKGGRRKSRRGKRRAVRTVKTHVVSLPRSTVAVTEKKRRRRKKKAGKKKRRGGGRRKRALMENPSGFFSGPGPMALYENQAGPFTMAGLRAYGVAAVGVGLGLIVADVTDRLIATRTPKDGRNPWYGKDAAGAIRMRPDAWRLGGQAGGAVAGMAVAYWARGRGIIPWLVGGIAVGFGANLVKQLWDWYLAPTVMKVELADAGKPSIGNRLYSLEQNYIQEQVAKLFAQRPFVASLAPGQNDPPQITSPLGGGGTGAGPMYQLSGQPGVGRPGQNARSVIRTGRVGTCQECGCSDGCYSNCPTLCPDCPEYNQNTMCRHQVQAGDDINAFASAGGVSVEQILALNPNTPWTPGSVVFLPYGVCSAMEKGSFNPVVAELNPVAPPSPLPVPLTAETMVEPPGGPVAPPAAFAAPGVYGTPMNGDDHIKKAMIFSGGLRRD